MAGGEILSTGALRESTIPQSGRSANSSLEVVEPAEPRGGSDTFKFYWELTR